MQRRHSHTTSHGSHGSGSWLIFAFFSVLIVLSSFYLFQSYDNIIPTVRLGNWISPAHLQEKQHTSIEEQTQSRTPVVQTSLARTAHAVLLVEIAAMMSSNIHRIHAGYLIEQFFFFERRFTAEKDTNPIATPTLNVGIIPCQPISPVH